MAKTTFSGPVASDNGFLGDITGNVLGDVEGDVTGNVNGTIRLTGYGVSSVPSAANNARRVIYVSNGAAGNPVLAFSDGTNWLRVDTLAPISAT